MFKIDFQKCLQNLSSDTQWAIQTLGTKQTQKLSVHGDVAERVLRIILRPPKKQQWPLTLLKPWDGRRICETLIFRKKLLEKKNQGSYAWLNHRSMYFYMKRDPKKCFNRARKPPTVSDSETHMANVWAETAWVGAEERFTSPNF